MIRAARRALGLAVACAALAFGGCDAPQRADESRLLTRGTTGEIVTLDPQFSVQAEAASLLHDLYEGLVRIDAGGRVQPGVAERWSVGEDGRVYTFELRVDARWSNGAPVTAEDFVWSLRRLVDPATASPLAGIVGMIENAAAVTAGDLPASALGVAALDERTLEIRLEHPAPYVLSVLAHPAAAPLHVESVERYDRQFTRAGNLVSNGPYRLVERVEQQHVDLERSPHYWNAAAVEVERVRYVPYEEQFAQFTAYRVGQIELTDVVPATATDLVRDQFAREFHARPTKDTFYYAFNLRDGPLAKAPRLREALSASIMRDVIVSEVTRLEQPTAYSFVPPMFGDYEPPKLAFAEMPQPRRDDAARAALAAAGEPPRLRVLYNTSEALRRITVAVTSMWRQTLGVETELANQEFGVFLQTLGNPAAWDVARLSWRADYDDPYAFLEIFTTGSPNNYVGYSDAVYDRLLARSHEERDPGARLALLREAERRLLDAHAIAPVYFYIDRVLAKPWIDLGPRTRLKPLPTAELSWRH